MRWHRYGRHHRPPWWPSNEKWPPAGREHAWRRGRGRFLRRIAAAFAALLFLSALGGAALSSILFGIRLGGPGLRARIAVPVIALVFLFGLLAVLVRRVGSPVGDIVEAANRVAEGDFATRITEHGPPPVRVVARAFNSMAARLESQDRQRRYLLADIAHELRTPLSVVQGRLEGLLDGVYTRDDARLSEVLDETRLLTRLVEDLRTLAHTESGMLALQKEPTDLAILIQDVVNSLSAEAESRQVSFKIDASSDLPLALVDPLRIREVLVNLLSNALHHTPADGVVSIAAGDERHIHVAAQCDLEAVVLTKRQFRRASICTEVVRIGLLQRYIAWPCRYRDSEGARQWRRRKFQFADVRSSEPGSRAKRGRLLHRTSESPRR